jgi:TolB protein
VSLSDIARGACVAGAAVIALISVGVATPRDANDLRSVGAAERESLAFSGRRDTWYVFTVRADGSGLRRLTRGRLPELEPAWSPDGRRVAFVRYDVGEVLESDEGQNREAAEIFVIDADGRNERRLTHARGEDTAPAWSPDGRRIAFVSERAGTDIYVMNADGSNQRRLTNSGGNAAAVAPTWSPTGREIAFSASAPEDSRNLEIFVMRADGSNRRRLTRTKRAEQFLGDSDPVWGRHGIVFTSEREGQADLWRTSATGEAQRALLKLPKSNEWDPAFSSDGTRLAYVSTSVTPADAPRWIWIARADGSSRRRFVQGLQPAWRPARRPTHEGRARGDGEQPGERAEKHLGRPTEARAPRGGPSFRAAHHGRIVAA